MVTIVMQSIPEVRTPADKTSSNYTNVTDPSNVTDTYMCFIYVDLAVCSALLVELVFRFICCPNKIRLMKTFSTHLTVLSLLPSIASGVYLKKYTTEMEGLYKVMDIFLRLRILRVIALLRYEHYYPTLRIFVLTFRNSAKAVSFIITIVVTLALLFGGCLYFFERGTVSTIPYGMWWASVTMTTLGYGDVYPKTAVGYAVGLICTLSGIVVLVLPIPVISKNFELYTSAMEEFEVMKRQARHAQYQIQWRPQQETV